MNRHVQVFVLAIAFDLYWTLVVIFRERGVMVWLALALLVSFLYSSWTIRFPDGPGGARSC